jgi:hypothetical protein
MARKSKVKKMYPVPEAIDGDKWDVRESRAAMTDTKGRTMLVPATDTDQGQYLRAHEMAHAKISPRVHANALCKKHGITSDAMQVCEDIRVNSFLKSRRIDRFGCIGSQDMCTALVKMIASEPRKLAGLLLASECTDDYDRVEAAIDEIVEDEDVRAGIFSCTDAVRNEFRRHLEKGDSARFLSKPRGFSAATVPAAKLFDRLFPVDGEFEPGEGGVASTYAAAWPTTDAKWGALGAIKKSRMTRRRKPRGKGGKSWRDEGAAPVAPYRLILDGRIFCRKQRVKGGTVLIDNSGSMSFSSDHLERIVEAAPGAVVACYSGNSSTGELTIVAERGRMASKLDLAGVPNPGGNVVDGPALRWLAAMPGPRVWVSDGFVTGVGDRAAINLYDESRAICRQASIKRVERADAVTEELV